jgi:hypothetical protein
VRAPQRLRIHTVLILLLMRTHEAVQALAPQDARDNPDLLTPADAARMCDAAAQHISQRFASLQLEAEAMSNSAGRSPDMLRSAEARGLQALMAAQLSARNSGAAAHVAHAFQHTQSAARMGLMNMTDVGAHSSDSIWLPQASDANNPYNGTNPLEEPD